MRRLPSIESERGGIVLTVALVLPALLIVLSFTVDTANWWVHKRHLQTQADAGALAAGAFLQRTCATSPGTQNTVITNKAFEYAVTRNPQVGKAPAGSIAMRINKRTYDNQASGPTDTTIPVGEPEPCAAKYVDVKMTEHDVPWFFQKLAGVENINARARVTAKQIDTSSAGTIPLAFRNSAATAVAYQFVDESGSTPTFVGSARQLSDADGNGVWDEPTSIPVRIEGRRYSVRVALTSSGATVPTVNGNLDCANASCFEGGASTGRGISTFRGYSDEAIPADGDPRVGTAYFNAASLTGCGPDPYLVYSANATCNNELRADVRWNKAFTALDFAGADPAARVWALADQDANADCTANGGPAAKCIEMRYSAVDGVWISGTGKGNNWVQGPAIAVADTATASIDVSMQWAQYTGKVGSTTCTKNNPCHGTFQTPSNSRDVVQRIVPQGLSTSGPVTQLSLFENATMPVRSFKRCLDATDTTCTHNLSVTVQFEDLSKTIMLRANGTGSQNQSVDCGPSLKETLETGCTTGFSVIEPGETCAVDPDEPYHCVSASTGGKVGQINNLDTYFIGTDSTCARAPNRWPLISAGAAIDPTDRRLVKVFVTSFDSFANQQGTQVSYKILGFAYMYVTGWQAQSNDVGPCTPVNEPTPDPTYTKGSVWGHFVSFAGVNTGNETPGDKDCNFSDPLRGCVAVLTD